MAVEINDRTEAGHLFQGLPQAGCWSTTNGRKVLVFPPGTSLSWWVVIPSTRQQHVLTGEDAGKRAFSIAEGYSRQKD
jgi:hypothetical protein